MTKSRLPYIAELHDIGKLVDTASLEKAGLKVAGHTYRQFQFAQLHMQPPNSPSWWGQWSDSIRSLDTTRDWPSGIDDEGKACVLLTKIADTVASSVTRSWGKKGSVVEGVRLLWRPRCYSEQAGVGSSWAAFHTPELLRQMFEFIDTCRSPEEFLQKYDKWLRLTPEDKSVPVNFIPLRTHLELTGKIFRVLRFWSEVCWEDERLRLRYDGESVGNVMEAAGGRADEQGRGRWVFRLVQGHVRWPQTFARLQDLNILRLRRDSILKVVSGQTAGEDVERQRYAVLFYTDDFLSLFLPKEPILALQDVLHDILEAGFWFEYEELEAELNLITSTGNRTRQQLITKYGGRSEARARRSFELRLRAVWPEDLARETLSPPLCDLCQRRPGKEYLKDQVREWICDSCRGVREMGEPASEISDWEGEGKPLVWLKVSLDQDLLLQCLQRLFEEYVDHGEGMDQVPVADRQALKASFRPLAAQMEFTMEFSDFKRAWRETLQRRVSSCALLWPIPEYDELTVVRLDESEMLGVILDEFADLLQRFFPECLVDSPIRLSASLASAKYPYQEHWRFFQEPQNAGEVFHLSQPGVRRLCVTHGQYRALRSGLTGKGLSHFLHRVAAIESAAGELTAAMEVVAKRRSFPQIEQLLWLHNLTVRQILDFYRLVGPIREAHDDD